MKNILIAFSPYQVKIFIGTLIATFVVMTLHYFGVKAPRLIAPLPQKADVFYDIVSPKLEKVQQSYQLQKEQTSFISQAEAAGDYDEATAYAVIDFASGEVIASKGLSRQLPIASLTKIMSSVVALDLADSKEQFTVSKKAAAKIPTKIGARKGEQLTLEELLHATLLTSANDAVEVIKEGVDTKYGDAIFIRAMNEKASILGMKNTSFANAQGFDDVHNYSSVEDLAILTHYALTNYPLLEDIARKEYMLLSENSYHKQFDLYNWNGLMSVYPQIIGLKIGNTDDAGKTTVVVSERAGKRMIAIILNAPGILERDMWAAQLLDVGYERTLHPAAVNITEDQLREKYATWKYW